MSINIDNFDFSDIKRENFRGVIFGERVTGKQCLLKKIIKELKSESYIIHNYKTVNLYNEFENVSIHRSFDGVNLIKGLLERQKKNKSKNKEKKTPANNEHNL